MCVGGGLILVAKLNVHVCPLFTFDQFGKLNNYWMFDSTVCSLPQTRPQLPTQWDSPVLHSVAYGQVWVRRSPWPWQESRCVAGGCRPLVYSENPYRRYESKKSTLSSSTCREEDRCQGGQNIQIIKLTVTYRELLNMCMHTHTHTHTHTHSHNPCPIL